MPIKPRASVGTWKESLGPGLRDPKVTPLPAYTALTWECLAKFRSLGSIELLLSRLS